MGNNYNHIPELYKVYEWLTKERKHLYGVKTIDENQLRSIIVCKTKEMAEEIKDYLEKYRDLFFPFAYTEEEKRLINSQEFYVVTDLNEYLDNNTYVSVFARQLDDMSDFFKDYFLDDNNGNKIVEIKVINNEYITDVLD